MRLRISTRMTLRRGRTSVEVDLHPYVRCCATSPRKCLTRAIKGAFTTSGENGLTSQLTRSSQPWVIPVAAPTLRVSTIILEFQSRTGDWAAPRCLPLPIRLLSLDVEVRRSEFRVSCYECAYWCGRAPAVGKRRDSSVRLRGIRAHDEAVRFADRSDNG